MSELLAALAATEEDQAPYPEQVEILGLLAYFGQLPRAHRALPKRGRRLRAAPHGAERVAGRGPLRPGNREPNVYRVTAKALRAAG